MTNATKQIIEELSRETGIPRSQVEQAVKSQFRFTAHVMKNDTFETVHHQYLGKFKVNKAKLKQIQKHTNDKRDTRSS